MNDAHSNVNSTSGRLSRGNERLNICLTPCVRTLLRRNVRASRRSRHPPNGGSHEWGMREDREWMGELETEYLSVRRRRRPRPLTDEPTAAIHSEAAFRLRNWNYDVPRSPRLCARETACARFSTSSLLKMCLTCVLTVSGVMERTRAISLLDRPWAIQFRISPSRVLSGSALAEVTTALT